MADSVFIWSIIEVIAELWGGVHHWERNLGVLRSASSKIRLANFFTSTYFLLENFFTSGFDRGSTLGRDCGPMRERSETPKDPHKTRGKAERPNYGGT